MIKKFTVKQVAELAFTLIQRKLSFESKRVGTFFDASRVVLRFTCRQIKTLSFTVRRVYVTIVEVVGINPSWVSNDGTRYWVSNDGTRYWKRKD